MKRSRPFAGLVLLFLLAACGGSTTAISTAPTTAGVASGTPSTSATVSVAASPTSLPSSAFLTIDGKPAVTVAVPDPVQPAAYAATEDALYRAKPDGGWDQIGNWDGALSLLVDPTNPNILYSGGHPGCAIGGPAISLRKSTDGGNTWETLLTGQNVRPMLVDPSNPQVIYGERCSLAISLDGGQSWNDYPMTPSFDVSDLSLAGDTLYALITSEGGTSRIRPIDVSDPSQPKMGNDSHEFWGGGRVVATKDRIIVGEPHGVDVSTDGGKTWTFSRAGLESVTVSVNALVEPIPKTELSGKFGIYSLAIDPRDASHLVAGTIHGLYQSRDDGQSWTRDARVDPVQVNALAVGKNGTLLYVTTNDGVLVLPGS
jgi:photosystem II stability/assembly factor-like uncharacterized protein